MLRFIKGTLLAVFMLVSGCGSHDKNVLRVGTIAGPETELMQVAKQVAKDKSGVTIEIVEFSDYALPNTALNDGSIDANMFQHQPYLDEQVKDRHYNIVRVSKTFVYPMGIYSIKFRSLADLPRGAIVAIPNDASNEGRALLLLQKAGLIELRKSVGLYAIPSDIIKNEKKLVFRELDTAQLSRSLPDVGLAVINTNYAIPAGLSPTKDALFKEDDDSAYANIIVVRDKDTNDPRVKALVDAMQSDAVLDAAKKIFNGYAIPAENNK